MTFMKELSPENALTFLYPYSKAAVVENRSSIRNHRSTYFPRGMPNDIAPLILLRGDELQAPQERLL